MSTLSAGLLLFLIMDPLGNIPLFLSLLRGVDPKRRQLVLVLLIALVVLFVFLFGGTYLLHVLQLKQESVSIAGGIVLFLIGVRMVFPPATGGVFGGDPDREPFIVPMAIPGIEGPSAVAAVMLLAVGGGARYLAQLLKDFNGNTQLATAAYNAGEGAVQKYGGVPPYDETQVYVQRVEQLRDRYQKAL